MKKNQLLLILTTLFFLEAKCQPASVALNSKKQPEKNSIMEDTLSNLNIQLGISEQTNRQPESRAFLEDVLSEDLVFRRASKKIVTRKEYLDGLSGVTYERLETEIIEIKISSTGNQAIITCLVKAKGVGGNGPFEGAYKNIRFWRRSEKSPAGWVLYGWYNEDIL